MLPNGLVQPFSENILEVPDILDQHKFCQNYSIKQQSCFSTFLHTKKEVLFTLAQEMDFTLQPFTEELTSS